MLGCRLPCAPGCPRDSKKLNEEDCSALTSTATANGGDDSGPSAALLDLRILLPKHYSPGPIVFQMGRHSHRVPDKAHPGKVGTVPGLRRGVM